MESGSIGFSDSVGWALAQHVGLKPDLQPL